MFEEPKTQIQIVDNVFVKMHFLETCGQKVRGHAHTFDHITLLAVGSVLMVAGESTRRYDAPYLIVTPKGIRHEFECLSNKATLCCIHAIRDGDDVDDVASQEISPEEAQRLMALHPLVQIK